MLSTTATTVANETVQVAQLGSGSSPIRDFLADVKPEFVPDFLVPLTAAGVAVGLALALISVIAMVSTCFIFGSWI